MRKICGYLEKLFKPFSCHPDCTSGQRNRQREGNNNTVDTDYQGILNGNPELVVELKYCLKYFSPAQLLPHNSPGRRKILKCNGYAVHRYIGK